MTKKRRSKEKVFPAIYKGSPNDRVFEPVGLLEILDCASGGIPKSKNVAENLAEPPGVRVPVIGNQRPRDAGRELHDAPPVLHCLV